MCDLLIQANVVLCFVEAFDQYLHLEIEAEVMDFSCIKCALMIHLIRKRKQDARGFCDMLLKNKEWELKKST